MSYTVAVRELCEFSAKRGDLDLRFTPAPSAQEGIEGHTIVVGRRDAGYKSEVALSGHYGLLQVRGRCDGFDPTLNRLEEIKTYRGELERQPANHRALHWAQARVYGWLWCAEHGLDALEIALVYFDVQSQEETLLCESHTADELEAFFKELCEPFLHWAEQEVAQRQARDAALLALQFPLPDFRPGQRALAEAVYRGACTGTCLLAQAPTGIGKTIGTLFPLLKACPGQQLDRIFFLAAKTPGRALALEALEKLHDQTGPLRVLELTAKEKTCEHPTLACHGDSCPLARGFYDRLPAARAAAANSVSPLTQGALRALAREHEICPYYLAQEMARWCDVVVGDYNYFFDSSALLHSLTVYNDWKVALLVDEAHNLLERARSMYSASLNPATLAAAIASAPRGVKTVLNRVEKVWDTFTLNTEPYVCRPEIPASLLGAVQQAIISITEHQSRHPAEVNAALQGFYFEALQFQRMAEVFGPHALFDITQQTRNDLAGSTALSEEPPLLNIRNVLPAPFLQARFATAHSSVLFSATLAPPQFHRDTLGLPAGHRWLDVPSPFTPEQLSVRVVRQISTRYQHRQASIPLLAGLIANQYLQQPGNYLAFFSSHEYLQQVIGELRSNHTHIPCWQQSRQMGEAERAAFLARFQPEGCGIGFAVLGGAFGEGIDLPGKRLIGAFVATLGLPQLNPVNEQLSARLQSLFGQGHNYTYLYPGLQKVVQAAGRVIRGPEDQGVLYLIDDRFSGRAVRALLPAWWQLQMLPAMPGKV